MNDKWLIERNKQVCAKFDTESEARKCLAGWRMSRHADKAYIIVPPSSGAGVIL